MRKNTTLIYFSELSGFLANRSKFFTDFPEKKIYHLLILMMSSYISSVKGPKIKKTTAFLTLRRMSSTTVYQHSGNLLVVPGVR